MKERTLAKGDKKLLFAWAFYDWANSVFNLVITTAIFPIFYGVLFRTAGIESVEVFGMEVARGPLISYVTSLAFVFVALLNPLLSGIADYLGNKKMFLKMFAYLGALSCIAMYWFSLDYIYYSLACYFFGLVGFWISYAFCNSYLPDVANEDQQDWISARGFSLGYIGSVILLLFDLAMVMNPNWFGIEDTPSDPAAVKANAYDLVLNGNEIGGGSIRIHDKSIQSKMFDYLGFTPEEAKAQFGFLMDAFQYGAPPHGGIAFGLDRLVAILGGQETIRDFIAFPKNNAGRDVMIDAPAPIDQAQLEELNLSVQLKQ